MVSSFVHEIDKSGTAVPSFSTLAKEGTLVVAAGNGNEQAFEILGEHYRHRSSGADFTIATWTTGCKQNADSRKVQQELWRRNTKDEA